MNTIKVPIRFKPNSYGMVTVEDGSDEFYATILSNAMRIEPRQLPLSTSFGVTDPSFGRTSEQSVYSAAKFVPEITITSVSSKLDESGANTLAITFERKDQQ